MSGLNELVGKQALGLSQLLAYRIYVVANSRRFDSDFLLLFVSLEH